MPTTKAPTRSRKTSTAASDALGPEHEAILLAAYRDLPDILAEDIHDVEPLNQALRDCAKKRKKEIEAALEKVDLPEDQQAIWRAIPDIQFGLSGIPSPSMTLGCSLRRWRDARGEPKSVPETICVVDFCVEMLIPKWSKGFLRCLDNDAPKLNRPEDGLNYLGLRSESTRARILGLVFTSNTTVGQAVHQIERVIEAGRIDSVRHPYEKPKDPFVICVTNRWELAQVLAEKVDVMWASGGDMEVDLRHLLSAVSVN